MIPKRWEIYYDDGSRYTNLDGSVEDAPTDGVQVILDYNQSNGGRIIHQGMNYYWWMGDCWASGNERDLMLHLRKRPAPRLIILFGRWMDIAGYEKIKQRAYAGCEDC